MQNLPGGGYVEKLRMPFTPMHIAANGGDAIWVTGYVGTKGVLAKISTTGQIERLITGIEDLVGLVYVDAEGDAWVPLSKLGGGSVLAEYHADGTRLQQIDLASEHLVWDGAHMRMDAQGAVYFFGGPYGGGTRQDADGTVTQYNVSGSTVTPGTQDDIWVGIVNDPELYPEVTSPWVVRYSKAGAELGRYSVGAGYRSAYTAIDQQGNAWVTAMQSDWFGGASSLKGRLVKFSPQGEQLGVFELSNGKLANAVEIGADGRVWVVSGGSVLDGGVTWFSPAGVELGHYTVDQVYPWQFAVTSNGAWVVAGGASGDPVIIHVAP